MPSGFVEVSGYSKSDLDAAYQRGLAEGGSAVKGNATAAQVLQGYTFSSASAGSNKSGTMVNRGSFRQTSLQPGAVVQGQNGYYSEVYASVAQNTQTQVLTQAFQDLGATNLVRYADATNIVESARTSGYNSGFDEGFHSVFTNDNCFFADRGGHAYGSVDPSTSVYLLSGQTYQRDTYIIAVLAGSKSNNLNDPAYPTLANSTLANYKVLDVNQSSKTSSTLSENHIQVFKIPHGTTLTTAQWAITVSSAVNLTTHALVYMI